MSNHRHTLHIQTQSPRTRAWRFIGITLLFVCALCTALLAFALPFTTSIRDIYVAARNGQSYLFLGVSDLRDRNFVKAQVEFEKAAGELRLAYNEYQVFNAVGLFSSSKVIHNNKKAVSNLLVAATYSSEALADISNQALLFNEIIVFDSVHSFESLPVEKKDAFIQYLSDSPEKLSSVRSKLNLALLSLNQIPEEELLLPIRLARDELKGEVESLKIAIDSIAELSGIVPGIIGYPEEKTYLFLLLNNTEIRPGGGFIGTYGVVKIKDAQITEFFTDDIYNIDLKVNENTWDVEPPAPIKKYLGVDKWYMRDSNWSPDFPTSAQQAEWFYHAEGGEQDDFDGVIAVTPELIGPFLDFYGGIEAEGVRYTSENFIDILEYKVEQEFFKRGIPEFERKKIIGVLAQNLLNKIKGSSYHDLGILLDETIKSLERKEVLVYDKNDYFKRILRQKNWDGAIRSSEGDYVMVVDANLGSLKTDQVMEKELVYSVVPREDDRLVAKAVITYTNTGTFTWKTTRYNTYTRLYVPFGSELISSNGAMLREKDTTPGEVDVGSDLAKTVYGAYISVEPGQKKKLEFEYLLPTSITSDEYRLLIQKQPGNKLDFQVDTSPCEMVSYAGRLDTDIELNCN